jgi:hypothetical protein
MLVLAPPEPRARIAAVNGMKSNLSRPSPVTDSFFNGRLGLALVHLSNQPAVGIANLDRTHLRFRSRDASPEFAMTAQAAPRCCWFAFLAK